MKWEYDKQLAGARGYAAVKIRVQNHPAAGCFIFILKRTCVPIPVQSVVPMNGIPPTKPE